MALEKLLLKTKNRQDKEGKLLISETRPGKLLISETRQGKLLINETRQGKLLISEYFKRFPERA